MSEIFLITSLGIMSSVVEEVLIDRNETKKANFVHQVSNMSCLVIIIKLISNLFNLTKTAFGVYL